MGSDVKFLDLALEPLLKRGCHWVRNYLTNNPNVDKSDRSLCDGV